ncbi:hypothetical protein QU487_08185 [Crenobacter sp. SG2305]|uniref:hypothetical protein n=1 Tax=Crenobacter oryzisoli TaxID=3056844 RepID=UPI0025AAD40E|nr:hypothetical protein [Crenobacter sp. SG2305]MDN0082728.1 hypothetical protein [Crenobacter sp. SG2305]
MNERLQLALTAPVDHPAFPGHFPGQPILPGAALLDLAIVALQRALGVEAGTVRIASAKFLKPVGPGSALALSAEAAKAGSWHCTLSDTAGATVAQCELSLETAE